MTMKLLQMAQCTVNAHIKQEQLIMVIFTHPKIPDSVQKYSFVSINLNPYNILSFSESINKIVLDVKIGEIEESYYDSMPSMWKNVK